MVATCENPTRPESPTRPENHEASEDVVNENPTRPENHEASEDVAKENPARGRVNAARLVGLPNVSARPMTIIYEDFGLGRSAKRRADLEAGASPIEAPDPPLRGEGQTENEAKPALSALADDAALAYRDRMGSVTGNPSEEEVEGLTPVDPEGPGSPLPKEETKVVANPEYARLFTPDELDALEAGRPSPAAEEKEDTPRVGAERPDWSDELDAEENDLISDEVMNMSVKESSESPPEPVTDERLVAGNICMTFAGPEVEGPSLEEPAVIPFRLRALIRSVVYQIVLEEEARSELRCPACLDADTSQSEDSGTKASTSSYSVVEREARARLLTLSAAGVLGDRMKEAVVKQIMESYSEESPTMRTKRTARLSRCPVHAS
ncbi:hypothetical protein PF003_g33899 [Phytophthora fragariae]|nr:hypothetical protein PF003_g33899 [Phytophthora fragariae]